MTNLDRNRLQAEMMEEALRGMALRSNYRRQEDESRYLDAATAALRAFSRARSEIQERVIFLDLDAALSTNKPRQLVQTRGFAYSPAATGLVRALVDETNARLVITSSCRRNTNLLNMMHTLDMIGLSGQSLYLHRSPEGSIMGVAQDAWRTSVEGSASRGERVEQWLDQFGENVSHYVILGDEGEALVSQLRNTIALCDEVALTQRDYKQARRILDA